MEDRGRLLRCLQELTEEELRVFAYHLSPAIPRGKLDHVSPVALAELLFRYHGDEALDVAARALEKVPRHDLVRQLRRESRPREDRPNGGAEEEERLPAEAPRVAAPVRSRCVSDSELMKVARKMGRRWRQIGIEYLGTEISLLEQIEEENPNDVAMRAFYMLRNWRNREKEGATAARLYQVLHQEGVQLDSDAYAFLLQGV